MSNPFQDKMNEFWSTIDEQSGKYQVSYRQKQNGPYNKTSFDNEPDAKKFLADVEKKGGAGSIKTESVDENVKPEGDVVFKKDDFIITKRDTKGMRGTQDGFMMFGKEAGKFKNLGSHPSLGGAKELGKTWGYIKEDLDEATIKVKRPKNDQEIADRIEKLKKAGIKAVSFIANQENLIVVDSGDEVKAKKILGNIVESDLDEGFDPNAKADLTKIGDKKLKELYLLQRNAKDKATQEVAKRIHTELKKRGHSIPESVEDLDEAWQGPLKDDGPHRWAVDNRMLLSKALSQGHKFVATCGARKPQLLDWPLVSLNDFDKKFVRNVPLKANEYIFRLIPRMAVHHEMPLVKVNPKQGLIYFLTPRANEEDFTEFETRGTKLEYFRYIEESGIRESMALGEEKLAGWIAMIDGKKLEIKMGKDASTLYDAKQFAIKTLKVSKSKQGLLAIKPAYESVEMMENISKQKHEPQRQAIMMYQVKHKVSWEKAKEAIYIPIKAAAKAAAKANRPKRAPKTPAEKVMTDAQFRKMMKNTAQDFRNDFGNDPDAYDLGDVAWDIAGSLMYDPEVEKYVRRKIGKNIGKKPEDVNKNIVQEYIADSIVEDTDYDGEELTEAEFDSNSEARAYVKKHGGTVEEFRAFNHKMGKSVLKYKVTKESEELTEGRKPKKFDDVHIKSKNITGMVYAINGKQVQVQTPKGLVTADISDLQIMEDVTESIGNLTNVSDSVLKNMFKEAKKSDDKEAKSVLSDLQAEMKKRGLKESEELEEAKSKETGFQNKIKKGMKVRDKTEKAGSVGTVGTISHNGEEAVVFWKNGSSTMHLADLVQVKESEELDEISQDLKDRYKSKADGVVKSLEKHAKKGEYKDIAKSIIAKRKEGMNKASKPVSKTPFVPNESVELDEAATIFPETKLIIKRLDGGATPTEMVKDISTKLTPKRKQMIVIDIKNYLKFNKHPQLEKVAHILANTSYTPPNESVELEEQFKVGDLVIPSEGPHKGQKHEIIHIDGDKVNVKPIIPGWMPKNSNKYRQGAASTTIDKLKKA